MISVGHNIQSATDVLQKVPVSYLAERIISPQEHIKDMISRLRIIRNIDVKQYKILKKELPYFVCARFSPEYRRTENFAYTEYFIVDLDHLNKYDISIQELKTKLIMDSRIFLMFTSPSEDGLKLLFKLSQRCYDSGLYSVFYKAFTNHLAETYNITEVIDYSTHDVTRACFISWDPDAYYNPLADAVDLHSFIDIDNSLALFDMKRELEQRLKVSAAEVKTEDVKVDPNEDIMDRIKSKLKERQKVNHTIKDVFVPEILERIIDDLVEFVNAFEINLYEAISIQYGKKLRFRLEGKYAELNLFFGKKGFTVVECPKTGTNPDLNRLCSDIVKQFIAEYHNGLEK